MLHKTLHLHENTGPIILCFILVLSVARPVKLLSGEHLDNMPGLSPTTSCCHLRDLS